MARLRRRSWFQRTVLLAVTALLWSQFALAGHGGCRDLPTSPETLGAAATDSRHGDGHGHACDGESSTSSKALCDAHCTEGDRSADSGRIPSIPPLLLGTWLSWLAVADVADAASGVTSTWVDSPPRPVWHRPTGHPAALLLI